MVIENDSVEAIHESSQPEACLAAGLDIYIVKPIRVDTLVGALLQQGQALSVLKRVQ